MAAAGPASNLLMVIVTGLLIRAGLESGAFIPPDSVSSIRLVEAANEGMMSTLASFLDVFFSLNLLLFMFNLLPVPPLDGSGILPMFMRHETAVRYMHLIRNPGFALIGIVVAWNVFGYIYKPVHLAVVNLVYTGLATYGGGL
jgi:Zn-dependent protease